MRVLSYNIIHGGFKYLILLPIVIYAGAQVQPSKFVTDMSLCPSWKEMLPQMAIMFLVEDFFNYFIHAAMHHPLLYRFHKEHHEYKYSIPLTAWHFHYVEFVFLQLLSGQMYIMAAQAYAPVHIGTLMVWYIFRFWNNNSTHCGYVFPWTPTSLIPFCLNDEFHDFHHTHNSGNYGLYLRVLDVVFGTTKDYREFKAKQRKILAAKAD
jgi:sterol desaturase/sphingolipid hydroxylase (fatty acid hydroxylase superfamily)